VGKKYKIKTHKATAKRFRMTGSGKIVRTKGGKSHFRRRAAKRAKRMYDKTITMTHTGDIKRVKRCAPYLSKYKANPTA
jgi:large subunit ribosomal protein L35